MITHTRSNVELTEMLAVTGLRVFHSFHKSDKFDTSANVVDISFWVHVNIMLSYCMHTDLIFMQF